MYTRTLREVPLCSQLGEWSHDGTLRAPAKLKLQLAGRKETRAAGMACTLCHLLPGSYILGTASAHSLIAPGVAVGSAMSLCSVEALPTQL